MRVGKRRRSSGRRIHQRWISSVNMEMRTDTKFRKSLVKEAMGLFVQLLTNILVTR
uniref:Uncharacterized protein n=1 Tax=Arundo donax TaxID=35708 RepID=A0A0A9FIS5_ARUDO